MFASCSKGRCDKDGIRIDERQQPTTPQQLHTSADLAEQALFFHRYPRPGKLEIQRIKPLGNQRDLALRLFSRRAAPCLAIKDDPAAAADYTSRANLVAVISNGTPCSGSAISARSPPSR